ncbi:hypothetical protein SISSUDRAFT_199981 [Sistotremastrum suecicum HHB10207 ss-3]|uniref:F-box domain-containing protein n=1 Tax=Sistotremastrum suecicum HHB10207 ss-3 TaxID=1314776 RepID=A0A166AAP9_9AGAM|nr:hypothetical protein SISSUDRAFT_199981 [Sistotremastrum suecicum HHB10207 ss-3]
MFQDDTHFYAGNAVTLVKLKWIGNLLTENARNIRTLDLALSPYAIDSDSESQDEDDEHDTGFTLSQVCSPFLNSEAPSLRRFSLSMQGQYEDRHFAVDKLFLGHAPNLKALQLRGTDITLSRAPFPELTTLSLNNSGIYRLLYALKAVPSMLSQFPRLRSLSLKLRPELLSPEDLDVFRDHSTSAPHIVLPDLKSFTLHGLQGPEIGYLVEHVECPSLRTFRVTPPRFGPDPGISSTPIPRFPAWMHTILKDVRHLDLRLDNLGISVEFANQTAAKSFLWQIFFKGTPHETIDTYLNLFIENLPLVNPQSLNFQGAINRFPINEPSTNLWRSILSCFPRLTRIIADRETEIGNLIDVLAETKLICPALQELDIRGALFIGKRLHRMLVQRRANGGGIQRLNLDMEDCIIYDADYFGPPSRAVDASALKFDPAYGPKDLVESFSGDVRFLQHNSTIPKLPPRGSSLFPESQFSAFLEGLKSNTEDFSSFSDINFDRDFDQWLMKED